ncbi:CBS domain-containing protein [Lysinibacillus sp. NPDC097279]|uniref:CBS domain-containing protein n=1 Tax=Lysinibacillus sp. NPDC097279 TaxID=3364143 RepID=UPI0037F10E29
MNLKKYTMPFNGTIFHAMEKIEHNKEGFVLIVKENLLIGTLTDGDIRRALLNHVSIKNNVVDIMQKEYEYISLNDSLDVIVSKFKSNKIKYLPILNVKRELINVLTKDQLHIALLEGHQLDLLMDFNQFNHYSLTHEIYNRPWGFYKTVFLNEFAQAKIIHINPLQQISLQYHKKREEHWVVVKGTGKMIIGESERILTAGSYIFIPRGCLHRIKNINESEILVISEVQLGDYFGEDDIIRIEDDYKRNKKEQYV